MACLDTNVLIDLGSPRRPGHQRAVDLCAAAIAAGEMVCTTRFNVAELLVGLERAKDRTAEEKRIHRALAHLTVLEFDEISAEHFGRIQAHLLDIGRPAGDLDVLIAAVCLASGQRLITRNGKHFANIQGLVLSAY